MLKTLQLQNLVLVEKAQVDFQEGLNVITGETGAGKSLLVGALNLALGERADRGAVRAGAGHCKVEAVFALRENSPVLALLDEYGLPEGAPGELIVRRVISASGGRQFVNDSAVTLQVLKRIGDLLVDMHGPHDHQSLLDPGAQLALLDGFGRLGGMLRDYTKVYARHEELLQRQRELQQLSDSPRDWLEFQLRELEEAGLDEAEEAGLLEEQKLLGNSQRVLELAAEAGAQLMDAEASAFNTLASAHNAVEALEQLASLPGEWRMELAAAMTKVRETARELEGLMQRAEADPDRLVRVEQRLSVYQKIKRKYGGSVVMARQRLVDLRAELEGLRNRDERLAEIEKNISVAARELERVGLQLRTGRTEAGTALARAIRRELRSLDMGDAVFSVRLTPTAPGPSGLDSVEFEFSANPGERLCDLRAAASSGEISRVMLAVKSALAHLDAVPTLVFDEIDVNLGGRAAGVVGNKLRKLAERHQVLCITHLPQVAACGGAHYAVRKFTRQGRTMTEVNLLQRQGRVDEIARMLGGPATARTMDHAAEMLERGARNS